MIGVCDCGCVVVCGVCGLVVYDVGCDFLVGVWVVVCVYGWLVVVCVVVVCVDCVVCGCWGVLVVGCVVVV